MRNEKFHRSNSKGVNPYMKFLTAEDHLQHQVIIWCKLNKIVYHHSPNEGRRTAFEQFKFKYVGSDEGFIDLIFPKLILVIELKIKPNKPTPAQNDWLQFFESIGWTAKVCYNFEDAIEQIQKAKLKMAERSNSLSI